MHSECIMSFNEIKAVQRVCRLLSFSDSDVSGGGERGMLLEDVEPLMGLQLLEDMKFKPS